MVDDSEDTIGAGMVRAEEIRWTLAPVLPWEQLFPHIGDLDEQTLRLYAREVQAEARMLRTMVHELLRTQYETARRRQREAS